MANKNILMVIVAVLLMSFSLVYAEQYTGGCGYSCSGSGNDFCAREGYGACIKMQYPGLGNVWNDAPAWTCSSIKSWDSYATYRAVCENPGTQAIENQPVVPSSDQTPVAGTTTNVIVNFQEFNEAYQSKIGETKYKAEFDMDKNGVIEFSDYLAIIKEPKFDVQVKKEADFDESGKVDKNDFEAFKENYLESVTPTNQEYDLNNDNQINFNDYLQFAQVYEDTREETTQPTQPITTPSQTVTETSRKMVNCYSEPSNCIGVTQAQKEVNGQSDTIRYNPKEVSCGDLNRGGKCKINFVMRLNEDAQTDSQLNLKVDFGYESKTESVNSILKILESTVPSKIITTAQAIKEITGKAVNEVGIVRLGRYKCVISKKPDLCCLAPFFSVSEQDPNNCVYNPNTLGTTTTVNVNQRFSQIAQRYLELTLQIKRGEGDVEQLERERQGLRKELELLDQSL